MTSQSQFDRRRKERHPVNWPARCFTSDDRSWDIAITDLSESGFGLSQNIPLDVDERFSIQVFNVGVFPCRMAWKSEHRCGVELLAESGFLTDDGIAFVSDVLADLPLSRS